MVLRTSSSTIPVLGDERAAGVEDGEDFSPLVGTSSQSNSVKSSASSNRTTTTLVVTSMAVALICICVQKTLPSRSHSRHYYTPPHHPVYVPETNPGVGPIGPILLQPAPFRPVVVPPKQSSESLDTDSEDTFPDLPLAHTPQSRLNNLRTARQHLEDQLRRTYGSFYYDRIFLERHDDNSASGTYHRGRTIYQPANNTAGLSWERLKRKLMIKLLNNINDNGTSTTASSSLIWAVLGDARAAGHGNLRDETIPARVQAAAAPVLQAVGLALTVRSYAMRDTTAAPEIALCLPAIVEHYNNNNNNNNEPPNVDIVSWDYDLTDQGRVKKLALFGERAGRLTSRPVILANRLGQRYFTKRRQALASLEDRGLAALYMSELVWERAWTEGVPDSLGLTVPQRLQLPDALRDLRCRDVLEAGHEQCWTEQFNVTLCADRPGRLSWYSGWKLNAILGHLQAFFLLEVVEDALKEIIVKTATTTTYADLLVELNDQEMEDWERFQSTPGPADTLLESFVPDAADRVGLDAALFTKGHTYCHTARLPAEIRYSGVLTESTTTTTTLGLDNTFDRGLSPEEADAINNTQGFMRLVQAVQAEEDSANSECNYTQRLDFNDFFYTRTVDGWTRLVLPNQAEEQAYGSRDGNLQGLLAICFAMCPYNKCPRRNMDREAFVEKGFELTVNRVPVTRLVPLGGDDCALLQNEQGAYQWTPNPDGRFEFRARVLQPDSALRIGTFLIW